MTFGTLETKLRELLDTYHRRHPSKELPVFMLVEEELEDIADWLHQQWLESETCSRYAGRQVED